MHELHHPAPPAVLSMTAQEVTRDRLDNQAAGGRFKKIGLLLSVIFAVGLVTVVMKIAGGFGNRSEWGYHAAAFAYLLLTAQSAVLVSVALRMVRAHWRRSLARVSEMFAVVGLFNFLVFIPLLWLLPSTEGRLSLWFDMPGNSAHIWDTLTMAILVLCGFGLLYFAAIPDLATIRDHSEGSKMARYRRLALGWEGTPKQWRALQAGLGVLGGFYFLMLIYAHAMISVDFSMSLVPGWKDAIFPTYHALSGLQAGIATLIVTMFILRRFGGLEKYIEIDQFWALSKILLATCLLWFYFWWAGFFTYWYGRTPAEQSVLQYIMFDTYRIPFFSAFALCFPMPFLILMWNIMRKTDWGPTLAASFVLLGAMFNVVRMYVPAFGVEDPSPHALKVIPVAIYPTVNDILGFAGVIAGGILVYMLSTRIFPLISLWEVKEGMLLQRIQKFLKTEIRVMGKPE